MRCAVTVLLVGSLVIAAGCSGGDPTDGGSAPAPTSTTLPAYEPVFEKGTCDPDRVPEDQATVECGTLVVPETRTKPEGRQVRLPVAIVRATAQAGRRPDPIVYFSGGPGYPGVTASNGFVKAGLAPDHDLIFFDQRGTGDAEPSLECPEFDESTYRLFETTDPPEVEADRQVSAWLTCRDRLLAEGVDLASYNTTATAADVADLRRALGIDEWNLLGISYGTAVALEVMRTEPEGIRSVVIDSVVPPDRSFSFVDDFSQARRVFDVLFAGCAASTECSGAFGDLRAALGEAVAGLDADPYVKTITSTSRPVEARFTGGDLYAGIWNAMYDTQLIALVPYFIDQVRSGNRAILDPVADDGLAFITGAAEGQTASVDCRERLGLVDVAALRARGVPSPEFATLASAQPLPLVCERWGVPLVEEGFRRVAPATVPVLVFGNEYDPITPPGDSASVAERLGEKATFVEFPALGHGATTAHPCPLSIFQAFVAEPTAEVDTACVAQMSAPTWFLG